MNPTRVKVLGGYVLAVALAQLCIYLTLTFGPDHWDWLFYFDPRIVLFVVETMIRGAEPAGAGIFQWLSALWLGALGALLLAGRARFTIYVVSEIILAAANIFFFALIVLANLSPSHGFSVGELFIPIIVMIFATVVPLWLALRRSSDGGKIEQLNIDAAGQV